MNLVAKEFVAAQDPADPGVLILSRFAGAARQLPDALLVNPHDPDAMADAMDCALRMPLAERQARWRSLFKAIEHRTPVLWGRSFLAALMRTTLPQSRLVPRVAASFAAVEDMAAAALPPAPRFTLVERLPGEREPEPLPVHRLN